MAKAPDRDAVLREGRMCLSASPENRRILVISGARGIGKSTVANTIADEATALGFRVVDLPCLAGLLDEGLLGALVLGDADATPTLLVIDDLHLLPGRSRDRLARAVKAAVRIPNVRCVATTVYTVPPPLWREFAFHRLRPLSEAAVRDLLNRTETVVAQRQLIVELSQGNPLVATELARAAPIWHRDPSVGGAMLDRAHLTDTLADIGAFEVAGLDEESRRHILGDAVRHMVSREHGSDSVAARPSVDTVAQLWVLASSTAEERIAVHLECAVDSRLTSDERLVHRALAARAPDAHLVAVLDDRANDMVSMQRYRRAVALLCRAAALEADRGRARALEVRAASMAAFAGFVDLAESILDRMRPGRRAAALSETVPARAFTAVARGGDPRAAFGVVVQALDRLPDAVASDVVDQLIGSVLAYSALTGDSELVAQALQWAIKHEQHLDPVNVLVSRSLGVSGSRVHVRALDSTALLDAARASLRTGDPWKPVLLQLALPTLLWDPNDSCRLSDVVDPVADGFPAAEALARLQHLGALAARGQFAAFAEAVSSGLPEGLFAAQECLLNSSVAAVTGDEKGCTTAESVASSRFDVAYERMRRGGLSAERCSVTPYGPLEILDYVESCVRLRRPAEARTYLDRLHRTRPDFWGARHSALLAAAEAMLAKSGAEALFEASLHELRTAGWCFDTPRVALVYGEWLRRHHRATESRGRLRYAADLFAELGAHTWLRRAEDELRAAGAGPHPREGDAGSGLTGQELRIASLAAAGLTNKEIGEQLYLSARTVGGHLYRVFPKLQITTRSALRDALLRYEDGGR
ncbi:LuxR C-terminal-related transcriptional regulator [Rhodococcus sp. IEGM 1354]|uniref:LuxR C-terminal-related transcriptional regulator n=1 Tax=Rhodococcus sp. IEGM 1354 TaxID=3047088 RepID=UPI0024B6C4A9|nr:LuxR C-terminal-related transcriptional regulator [Rhodococcus sp. IEGM 1354]MDI9929186.1 LuxR C-terminal-related transcriptional regulator [Rhodococcus sp. IEGM 1354]